MLLLYGLVVILGILGSAIAWRRQRPALVLLSVPIVYLTLLTLLTIPAQRYMLPAIPFFIVLASLPVSTCVNSRVLSRHPFRDAPVTLKRITS
jgi:predicted MFS family arabinose efflux permease